jgi:RNA polymerase sigma-70 factor (ECF subfamily)
MKARAAGQGMAEAHSATPATDFERHRSRLRGLAYRMLGSVADAEDIVQDAWLRWHAADATAIDDVGAYLTRIVTHLCLDSLKSARARREHYVGQWLPEPLLTDLDAYQPGPEAADELARDLSFALLRTLDTLSPLERAAFLLHDVFDVDFNTIASTLAREPAACRQLANRARRHVRAARPRFVTNAADGERLAAAFIAAIAGGDLDGLTRVLADDAVFYSDGGGKVAAVLHPLHGGARVAKALRGFVANVPPGALQVAIMPINGRAGVLVRDAAGRVVQTIAFEFDGQARIAAIYVQRNPDKLGHLAGA